MILYRTGMTFDKVSIIIEQIKELKRVHGKNILSSSRPLVMQYCCIAIFFWVLRGWKMSKNLPTWFMDDLLKSPILRKTCYRYLIKIKNFRIVVKPIFWDYQSFVLATEVSKITFLRTAGAGRTYSKLLFWEIQFSEIIYYWY